ncbi:COG4315 family predicted lipoprotein [Massilia hydrophila]|uniref:COG4315 family predicted lipoprotein n=1 Tax=Massilia hydrophila TaxID=3044279 RepID=UPI003F7490D6
MNMLRVSTAVSTLLFSTTLLAADGAPLRNVNGVLVDSAGMTVYTYDKDTPGSGKSSCVATCATNWPPVMAQGTPAAPYSVVTREDGGKQLAHKGKPLYTFVKDKKAGDRTGDGVGGAWHVVAGD